MQHNMALAGQKVIASGIILQIIKFRPALLSLPIPLVESFAYSSAKTQWAVVRCFHCRMADLCKSQLLKMEITLIKFKKKKKGLVTDIAYYILYVVIFLKVLHK